MRTDGMRAHYSAIAAPLLALSIPLMLIAGVQAQESPIDSLSSALRQQIDIAQNSLSQQINETEKNISDQAKARLKETVNQSINATSRELERRLKEDVQEPINRKIEEQPGFQAADFFLICISAAVLMRIRE